MSGEGRQASIVVTGRSTVCAAGVTVDALLAACTRGATLLGAPVDVALPDIVGGPVGEFAFEEAPPGETPRLIHAALVAARAAVHDAGLTSPELNGIDVIVGTGGGCRTPEDWVLGGLAPALACEDLGDRRFAAIGQAVRADLASQGRVITMNTACSAGLNAVAHGWGLIAAGRVERVLCLGADELWVGMYFGFAAIGALSPAPCEPFGASTGTTLAEGAAAVILESEAAALARRASMHGRILGFGQSADAFHPSRPDPTPTLFSINQMEVR